MARSGEDLTLKVGFDIDKFQKELQKTNQQLSSWASDIQKSIMGLAGTFSALALGEFVLDVSKLAGEAEGVRAAFDKLPGSVQLMHDLKEATHGTVSELELMKRSVMASNFDISLKELPKLLEFATLRAQQTGQSVDYLVDSIVTGIGRKSTLILDNLGISATKLKGALGGVGTESATVAQMTEAVGKIIDEVLPGMGTMGENASTKIERLGASWVNLKVAIGDAANGTGVLGQAIDGAVTQMQILATRTLSFWEKLLALTSPTGQALAQARMLTDQVRKLTEEQKTEASVMRDADIAIKTFGKNLNAIKEAYKQNIHFREIMEEIGRRQVEQEKKNAEAIKGTTQAINSNNAAQARRIAGTVGFQATGPAVPGIPVPSATITGFAESVNEAYRSIAKSADAANRAQQEFANTFKSQAMQAASLAAQLGDAFGQHLGNLVTQAETFRQAILRMSAEVVDALQRVVFLRMVAQGSTFGPLGIAAAMAGFSAFKTILNNMSNKVPVTSSSGLSSYQGNGLSHLTVSGEFRLKGQDLVASIKNENRRSRRSGV